MSSLGAGSYKATLVMSLSWARLPQLLSVYLLMFVLGHFTRYSPGYFSLYYNRWTGEMLFTGTSGCRITRWTLLFVQDLLCKFDSRQRTVPPANWHGDHHRPIFFFELRDRYVCSWCELHGSQLILVPSAQPRRHARHMRYPGDATIVGRVTAGAMLIAEARDSLIKGSPLI